MSAWDHASAICCMGNQPTIHQVDGRSTGKLSRQSEREQTKDSGALGAAGHVAGKALAYSCHRLVAQFCVLTNFGFRACAEHIVWHGSESRTVSRFLENPA